MFKAESLASHHEYNKGKIMSINVATVNEMIRKRLYTCLDKISKCHSCHFDQTNTVYM